MKNNLSVKLNLFNSRIKDLAIVYLFLALLFGSFLVFLTPPFQGPDEPAHFFRSYQLSEANLIPEVTPAELKGVHLPKDLYDLHLEYMKSMPFRYDEKHNLSFTKDNLFKERDEEEKTFFDFSYLASNLPLTYFPQSFAIFLGNLFNAPFLITLYFSRLFTLITVSLVTFFAIKNFKGKYKAIAMLIGLFPMTLFLGAVGNPDALLIATILLFTSLVLKIRIENKINKWQILLLFITSLIILLTKQTYFLVPLLTLIIPWKVMQTKLRYGIFIFSIFVIPLIFALGVKTFIDSNLPKDDITLIEGLTDTLQSPKDFLINLNNEMLRFNNIQFEQIFGKLGWLDTSIPLVFVLFPLAFVFFILIFLKTEYILDNKTRLISLLIVLSSVFSVYLGIYLLWNVIGGEEGSGVQGRYFIPILIFLSLILNSKNINIELNLKYKRLFFICFLIYIHSFVLLSLLNRYYITY